MSPFFTGKLAGRRCVIWSDPPPTEGAVSIIAWLARSSPVAWILISASPRSTNANGISSLGVLSPDRFADPAEDRLEASRNALPTTITVNADQPITERDFIEAASLLHRGICQCYAVPWVQPLGHQN